MVTLARKLVQVHHATAATAAAQVLAQHDRRTVLAEALNVVGGVEDASVLAASADGDERHLGSMSWPSVRPRLSIVAARYSHVIASSPATSAESFGSMNSPPKRSLELLGVRALGKAEDEHVGVVAAE